jgi:hypothetical protein
MFCVMIGGQVTGGIFGVMLAWVSLYNDQGNAAVIVSGGGVPTDEIVMLLPD